MTSMTRRWLTMSETLNRAENRGEEAKAKRQPDRKLSLRPLTCQSQSTLLRSTQRFDSSDGVALVTHPVTSLTV